MKTTRIMAAAFIAAIVAACGSGDGTSQLVEFPDPNGGGGDDAGCTCNQDGGVTPDSDGGVTTQDSGNGGKDSGNADDTGTGGDSGNPGTDAGDSGSGGQPDAGTGNDSGTGVDSGNGQDAGSCHDSGGGPPPPVCGDGTCNGEETCKSCPKDCGSCPPPPPICGDGTCNGQETCSTCPSDCGQCPPPPPVDGGTCDKDDSDDSCGHVYGCCVSTCAHVCHQQHPNPSCHVGQDCFKTCQEECKDAKDRCDERDCGRGAQH